MGEAVKYHARTAVAAAATAQSLTYTHDPKGKASRIGIIACAVDSGAQTGSVRIYLGNSAGAMVEIGNGTFTAADPTVVLEPNFVLHPGMVITATYTITTAGDIISMFIGGH